MQNFVNYYSNLIRSQGAFYMPAGYAKVSFVDVRDIAAVAVKSLINDNQQKGRTYNITGGEALSYGQAAEILSKAVGKKINYVNVTDKDARNEIKERRMNEGTIKSRIEFFEITRAG